MEPPQGVCSGNFFLRCIPPQRPTGACPQIMGWGTLPFRSLQIFTGGLMLKLKLQYFGPWCEELTHLKRPWCWERLKTEEVDRGWDGWMASPIWWTWVWASSRSWWQTRKPGVLQCMELQGVGHNWGTEPDWTKTKIPASIKLTFWEKKHQNRNVKGFPGGSEVKNPPPTAEDMGSNPGPGRSHLPQLLKHKHLGACVTQEKELRWEARYHNAESLYSLQLEKTCTQQQRCSTTHNKKISKS